MPNFHPVLKNAAFYGIFLYGILLYGMFLYPTLFIYTKILLRGSGAGVASLAPCRIKNTASAEKINLQVSAKTSRSRKKNRIFQKIRFLTSINFLQNQRGRVRNGFLLTRRQF
jgi:hypothetical protein